MILTMATDIWASVDLQWRDWDAFWRIWRDGTTTSVDTRRPAIHRTPTISCYHANMQAREWRDSSDPLGQEQLCHLSSWDLPPPYATKSNLDIAVDLTESFFIHNLRWSTISHIACLIFTSGTTPLLHTSLWSARTSNDVYKKPHFSCTGLDILARHNDFDFRYSPQGPDACMSLSIRNWVSTGVTRAELSRIEQELEALMSNDPLP